MDERFGAACAALYGVAPRVRHERRELGPPYDHGPGGVSLALTECSPYVGIDHGAITEFARFHLLAGYPFRVAAEAEEQDRGSSRRDAEPRGERRVKQLGREGRHGCRPETRGDIRRRLGRPRAREGESPVDLRSCTEAHGDLGDDAERAPR